MSNDELLQKILATVIEIQQEQFKANSRLDNMDSRISGIESRLDNMDSRISGIESRLDNMDSRISGIESKLDNMDSRISGIESRLNNMDSRISSIESRLDKVENDLTNLKLIIETETNKKIDLTLDGVIGLIEKTDNYYEISDKIEENSINIGVLNAVTKEHSIKFDNLKKAL